MVKRLVAIMAAAALLWASALPAGAITLEEERKIGEDAFQEVIRELPMVNDPDVLGYIRGLGAELEKHLDSADPFKYRFYVADVPEMNAFALPGGWLVFYTGMITSMENEAELVGVMAHEMSHVHYRHIDKRIQQSGPVSAATMAGMLAGMILGGLMGVPQLGQALTMGSLAGGMQSQLAFSREQEEQADYGAFKILTSSGYPASEMEKSFNRVWRQQRYTMPNVPEYLLTHPSSPSRVEAVENLVRRYPQKLVDYDNRDFLLIRSRILALYGAPDSSRLIFEREVAKPVTANEGYYGLALLNMRASRYDLALRHMDLMTGAWATDPRVIRDRGICHLRLGQFKPAVAELHMALATRPKDTLALSALGEVYEQEGRLAEAVDMFQKVVDLAPDNDEARYRLGVALGRSGDTARASLELGLAFKARGNYKAARYHLDKAARELTGRPALQAKAQKALDEMEGKPGKPPKAEDGGGVSVGAGTGWLQRTQPMVFEIHRRP